jgi:hypothetical protein
LNPPVLIKVIRKGARLVYAQNYSLKLPTLRSSQPPFSFHLPAEFLLPVAVAVSQVFLTLLLFSRRCCSSSKKPGLAPRHKKANGENISPPVL